MTGSHSKIIDAVQSADGDAGRIVGASLKALREMVGITQEEMAAHLGIGQAAISKIEHRGDVQISSLKRYVEALGASLRIEATFPAPVPNSIQCEGGFVEFDHRQLILPIFGIELHEPHRDIVLSIHPQYSKKIMDGHKTVELRRRFPLKSKKGTLAYIYATSPVQAIVGSAIIDDIVKLPLKTIWDHYGKLASVERNDFEKYFSGLNEGIALKFKNVRPLPRAIELPELRKRFGFEPPQSFLYAKPGLQRALKDEYSNVSY